MSRFFKGILFFIIIITYDYSHSQISTSLIDNNYIDQRVNKWHIVDYYSKSPTHSWWCGPTDCVKFGDDYTFGYDTWLISPRLQLDSGAKKITLTLWTYLDTDNDVDGGDSCSIYIQSDQLQPFEIWKKNSPYKSNGWEKITLDLTQYRGHKNFTIKFYFNVDEDKYIDDGWFIDDIIVESQLSMIDLISTVEFDKYLPDEWSQEPVYNDTNDWHQWYLGMDKVARRYYQPYEMESVDSLISPTRNATYFTKLYLTYWTAYQVYEPKTNRTYGYVLGSDDGGNHWNNIIKEYKDTDVTRSETIDISSWAAGKNKIRLKWMVECEEPDDIYYWMLDSIQVYGDMNRKDINDDVEHGRDGWRVYPPDHEIDTSSIGLIKSVFIK
ncbi:MAG: hypothetical protein ACUVWP_02530 [bacterium]